MEENKTCLTCLFHEIYEPNTEWEWCTCTKGKHFNNCPVWVDKYNECLSYIPNSNTFITKDKRRMPHAIR